MSLLTTGTVRLDLPDEGPRITVDGLTGMQGVADRDGRAVYLFGEAGASVLVRTPNPDWQAVIDTACGRIDRSLNATERTRYFLTSSTPTATERALAAIPLVGPALVGPALFPQAVPAAPCGRASVSVE